ncbi:10543_t:CDS:2 [Diversispora eburnea]|uniref:10543_t:CDS:1 n=1 Tax=Diversispora eburnea TaxID=1213867 RepID=A0A9N8W163_9GLOM|nr:10543_t:CDS:2 [Diversispora eburnea]
MILLLQYPLTRCSVSILYLPSAPSELRSRSVKPIHILTEINNDDNNEEFPYWDEAIDEYFDRPDHPNFHSIIYPNYFRNYTIRFNQPSQNSNLFYSRDHKNRLIVQQKTPILLRFTTYKVEDGEPFLYLIMKIPVRSEQELLGEYATYRDRFQAMFPIRYNQVIELLHRKFYNTTHIVNTRQAALDINQLLYSYLPFDHTTIEPLISISEDTLDFEILNENHLISYFKHSTNLPHINLREGACVMFLNNKLFDDDICNGSITKIVDNQNVEVTFPTFPNLSKVIVQKETAYFMQGLTTSIDESLFAEGQAYVAMSRATSWQNLRIINFDYKYLISPKAALNEYKRLNIIHARGLLNLH